MTDKSESYQRTHASKANMDAIYIQPDPRAYFKTLGELDYVIPDQAKPVFQSLIRTIGNDRDRPVTMLDIGCSYGVNAALLKHDLSMADLHRHWTDPRLASLSYDALIATDRAYFDAIPNDDALSIVGLDQSEPAITYAADSRLLDTGLTADLETEALSTSTIDALAPVDLVVSTGCVGYVGVPTFERLLPTLCQGEAPWMAHFVLRMFPFDAIADTLSDVGYVTEKVEDRTFVQRNFASIDEREGILNTLNRLGIDPTGRESDGRLHAELFVSRPAGQTHIPVEELLARGMTKRSPN